MHHIAIEPLSATVEVTLTGTASPAAIDALMADLRQAIARHRLDARYGIVIDAAACAVQTQETIRAMAVEIAAMPRARAIAIVVTGPLLRLQMRRLFEQDYARIVATPQAARSWVINGREPASDAAPRPLAASLPA